MELTNRLKHKLFKCYKGFSVEYHAGGFFIRKEALYIFFDSTNTLILLEKKEGLHPYDSDYSRLISNELTSDGNRFDLSNSNNNLAAYKSGADEIKIMPSIFSENMNDKEITEIVVDWGNDKVLIFHLIDLKESSNL